MFKQRQKKEVLKKKERRRKCLKLNRTPSKKDWKDWNERKA